VSLRAIWQWLIARDNLQSISEDEAAARLHKQPQNLSGKAPSGSPTEDERARIDNDNRGRNR